MPKTEKRKAKYKTSAKKKRQYLKLKADFLTYFRQLPIQKLAAGFIGKSEDAITDWKNKDKQFSDQIASAKSAWALCFLLFGGIRLSRVVKYHQNYHQNH